MLMLATFLLISGACAELHSCTADPTNTGSCGAGEQVDDVASMLQRPAMIQDNEHPCPLADGRPALVLAWNGERDLAWTQPLVADFQVVALTSKTAHVPTLDGVQVWFRPEAKCPGQLDGPQYAYGADRCSEHSRYLTFIVECYDRLPARTVFAHDHVKRGHDPTHKAATIKGALAEWTADFAHLTSDKEPFPLMIFEQIASLWDRSPALLKLGPRPTRQWCIIPYSQFVASSRRIRARARDFYVEYLDNLRAWAGEIAWSANIAEDLWDLVLAPDRAKPNADPASLGCSPDGPRDAESAVMLWASQTSEQNRGNTDKLETLLRSKRVEFTKVDGTGTDEEKALRSRMFELSGQRGTFPQMFLKTGDDEYEFLGTYDQIQAMNEASDMVKEMPELKENEEVMANTFETKSARVIPS